jgi:hypothetical protein
MAAPASLLRGPRAPISRLPPRRAAVPQSWVSNTPLCNVWQAYCTSLKQAPLPTKAATGMLGAFLGDLIAQYLAHYGKRRGPERRRRSSSGGVGAAGGFQYDAGRCIRLLTFSAFLGTPMAHYWCADRPACGFWEGLPCTCCVALLAALGHAHIRRRQPTVAHTHRRSRYRPATPASRCLQVPAPGRRRIPRHPDRSHRDRRQGGDGPVPADALCNGAVLFDHEDSGGQAQRGGAGGSGQGEDHFGVARTHAMPCHAMPCPAVLC